MLTGGTQRRTRRRIALALAVFAIVTLAVAGTALAISAETFVTTQLTDNTVDDYEPQVSGDRLVWYGYDGSDYNVYTWALGDSSPTSVSDNTLDDYSPQVSGDRVVWYGYDGSDFEIYTWALGDSSPTQITDNTISDYSPQVSGDQVVWYGYDGSDYEVYTWTLGDSSPTQITGNTYDDYSPQVSGDRVVWYGSDGSDDEIYTWVVGDSAPTQLTNNATGDHYAQVSGDRVAWVGYDGSDYEVYTWALGDSAPTQISDDDLTSESVVISGDRLAWWSGWDVYTWALGDSSPTNLTASGGDEWAPQVSGERVVWQASDGSAYQIYTWNPVDGVSPVTASPDNKYGVRVSGDRMVWYGSDGSDDEIYTAVPGVPTPAPTVSGVSPDEGPVYGGQDVTISGTDFTDVTAVAFGDTELDSDDYIVVSDTVITATTPSHIADTVDVIVTTDWGKSTETDNYTYVPTPWVSKLSPTGGPTTGGTLVTITGGDFTGVTSVRFEKKEAIFTFVSDTEIKVISPSASTTGTVEVRVTTPGGTSGEETAVDEFTYVNATPTRYQETDGRLIYTAVWTTSTYWPYSMGNAKYSYRSGATVTIPFRGTSLTWVTKTARDLGIASVSVDGGAPVQVDLYSPLTAYKQKVFSTGYLADGLHWVKISHTGTRNTKSVGHAITIDAVDVAGQLAWATRYQENDPRVMFGPGWATAWNWSFSGGKLKLCSTPPLTTAVSLPVEVLPGSVVVRFKGVCLNVVAVKSLYSGKAWVSVDGGAKVPVDLYSPVKLYKQTVFSTGFLAPGMHTVTISWSGLKNTYSKATNINVDAFDIIGDMGVAIF